MRPLFPQPEDKAERDLEVGDWLKVIAKDLAKHLPREEADVILKGLQSPLEDLWWDLLLFEKIETVIDEKSYLEERIERLKTDSGNIQSLFKFAKMPPGMAEATIAGLKFLESKFDSQMENLNKEVLSKRNLPKKNLDLYNVRSLKDNIRDSLNRIHKHLSNVTKMKNLADHVFWRLRRDWISSEIPFNRDFELTSADRAQINKDLRAKLKRTIADQGYASLSGITLLTALLETKHKSRRSKKRPTPISPEPQSAHSII